MTDEERNGVIAECAACVPTNWLDPLLTGPKKVIAGSNDGFNGSLEAVLLAVKSRIEALSRHES